jgi:Resolvase, N terminal domain
VRSGAIDIIVVYKVDRLTRSLADFAKLVELFDAHEVSFVSVTQFFNTTSSMGRLTLKKKPPPRSRNASHVGQKVYRSCGFVPAAA